MAVLTWSEPTRGRHETHEGARHAALVEDVQNWQMDVWFAPLDGCVTIVWRTRYSPSIEDALRKAEEILRQEWSLS